MKQQRHPKGRDWRVRTVGAVTLGCIGLSVIGALPAHAAPAPGRPAPHVLRPKPPGAAAAATPAAMSSHGGPVETAPAVYVDFWGWQSDPSGEAPYLAKFLSSVGGTPWLNPVTEYGGGNPASLYRGAWSDAATVPAQPTDAQLQAEAVRAADHFKAGTSANVQIIVATPSGHSAAGFGAGGYCAYHGVVAARPSITYTNLPYMTDAGRGCGAGWVNGASGNLDGVSIVEGHELAETITDPLLSAWYDSSGNEIGDKCAWSSLANVSTSQGTFAVQPLWSNASMGCVLNGSVTTPDSHGIPRAVTQANGTIDVFYRSTAGTLGHKWSVGGNWFGPENLGGALASDPTPVLTSPGVIEVFWEGNDRALWHRWFTTKWNGPESLGSGPLGGPPQAVGQANGGVDVFWAGQDHQLWHRWFVNNSWNGPEFLGGALASDPSPVVTSPGVLDVFWKGTDNAIWHKWFTTGWNGPEAFSVLPLGGAPHAVGQPNGTVDVFWAGPDQQLWHRWFVNNSWNGPEILGGGLASDPSPVLTSPGVIDVFWKGTDNDLWHKWFTTGWNGPQSLGDGPLVSAPGATAQSNGIVHVFWVGADASLWQAWFQGAWNGPQKLI